MRKYKKFFGGFGFLKYRKFLSWWSFFTFSNLGWKVQGSSSGNIIKTFFWENIRSFLRGFVSLSVRNFCPGGFFYFFELGLKSAGFHFWKHKENFPLRKYKKFFRVGFFRKKLWELRLKCALGSYIWKTSYHRCLTVFWICLGF